MKKRGQNETGRVTATSRFSISGSRFVRFFRSICTKNSRETIENEKILKNYQKFSKRVFTNSDLCGKILCENIRASSFLFFFYSDKAGE